MDLETIKFAAAGIVACGGIWAASRYLHAIRADIAVLVAQHESMESVLSVIGKKVDDLLQRVARVEAKVEHLEDRK